MEETRVQKYKGYRDSMITENAIAFDVKAGAQANNPKQNQNSSFTSTIPYEQVMEKTQQKLEEDRIAKRNKNIKILKITGICVGVALVLSLLIVFGILVF